MKKPLLALGLLTLALPTTQAQTWGYKSGTVFALQGCQRVLGSTLECTFQVHNNIQNRPLYFDRWGVSVAGTTGPERPMSKMWLDNKAFAFDQVARLNRGQLYTLRLQFVGFKGNVIKTLTIDEAGTRANIPLLGSAPSVSPVLITKNPATLIQSAVAATPNWKPDWRWATFPDGPMHVMVHGCYATASRQLANCYATLVSAQAKKRSTGGSGVSVLDDSVLMTFSNQPIVGGKTKLRVGDLQYTVPVQ